MACSYTKTREHTQKHTPMSKLPGQAWRLRKYETRRSAGFCVIQRSREIS
jgi:hypothetical protein